MRSKRTLAIVDENLAGLTALQRTFISPKAKFIYFRKGETENIYPIAAFVLTMALITYNVVRDYPKFKRGIRALWKDVRSAATTLLSRARQPLKRYNMRVIACPDEKEITLALEVLKGLGAGVRYIPRQQRGRFRFFVNERKYCLFVRRSNGKFSGVVGNDPRIIAALKDAFESEWKEIAPLQDKLVKQIPGYSKAKHWRDA